MTLYTCKCGNTRELAKVTIVHRDGNWEAKEAECECGLYMDSVPTEGIPTLKRTENSLSNKGDKLWSGAAEHMKNHNR